MMERVAESSATLLAAGSTNGFITIADNSTFYPGATAWLRSVAGASQLCVITDLDGNDKVGIRFIPENPKDPKLMTGVVKFPHFGRSDVSGFLANSTITMPDQLVQVYQPLFRPVPKANF